MRMHGRRWGGCGERSRWADPAIMLAMTFGRGFGRGFGGGNWHFDWDGAPPGGRGRRRVFESGELRLVLLKLIADQPRHGYDLIRAI
jgi:hypothetical protein